ncbi:DUF4838 domain-containing protein [Paenibacillus eucommiae]|uniref:DUF4838 domain-containing protein n=1 Tax=Paenibacillus eucommiae TaxID=1355755 RepID=A0ABS4IM91_9BACL|nr:DUF4838 domain-containing protein [Paenibacillus eucommiae]MBP1988680.1 hypothetical protein [Paenibacillus eucommiae]
MSGDTNNKLTIVVPIADAEKLIPYWANEEADIDFRREALRAARCTIAYAATELKRCISRTIVNTAVHYAEKRPATGRFIELAVANPASVDDSFLLEPDGAGIVITGMGRAGLLYGAYELLRYQGWRWYAPGEAGEVAPPERVGDWTLPESAVSCKPAMSLGRGFEFEYTSQESAAFFVWMSRNRLNVVSYRPSTVALCRKLGMVFKIGGHIFEALLDPDRSLAEGGTIWERHPEWYGMPASGKRTKEEALNTQFCVSRPDLLQYLGAALVNRVKAEWKEADLIDVWGFDTWGNSCMCADCEKLGGSTDALLNLISALRRSIDEARRNGEIGHEVKLILCGYEGTDSLFGPDRPVSDNLRQSGDRVVYAPINRCYAHDFDDCECPDNVHYRTALESWLNERVEFPVTISEYYNVSKFEDLPLLFTKRIVREIPVYHRMGVRGATYMHVPMINWGVRTLTQHLYAQMTWDVDTDSDSYISEYFDRWYGPYAGMMSEAYLRIEQAWYDIADWRAWKLDSILSLLLAWDGAPPDTQLAVGGHFQTQQTAAEKGRESLILLEEALLWIDKARMKEKAEAVFTPRNEYKRAVNPQELSIQQLSEQQYEVRLGEDRRMLLYGIDTMRLMTEFVVYHTSLLNNDHKGADDAWLTIEATAEKMNNYYVPIKYVAPEDGVLRAGLVSQDALTRSQLRELVRRCRAWRLSSGLLV